MERIRLRFRCDLRWDDLEGDDPQQRRCGACEQTVVNLSSLTRAEAERLLAERVRRRERVCVRFVQAPDGRVEYAEPLPQRRRLRVLGAAAALASLVALPRPAGADLSSVPPGKTGSAARRAQAKAQTKKQSKTQAQAQAQTQTQVQTQQKSPPPPPRHRHAGLEKMGDPAPEIMGDYLAE